MARFPNFLKSSVWLLPVLTFALDVPVDGKPRDVVFEKTTNTFEDR